MTFVFLLHLVSMAQSAVPCNTRWSSEVCQAHLEAIEVVVGDDFVERHITTVGVSPLRCVGFSLPENTAWTANYRLYMRGAPTFTVVCIALDEFGRLLAKPYGLPRCATEPKFHCLGVASGGEVRRFARAAGMRRIRSMQFHYHYGLGQHVWSVSGRESKATVGRGVTLDAATGEVLSRWNVTVAQ